MALQKGKFSEELQALFIEAQELSEHHGKPTEIGLKLIVYPRQGKDDLFTTYRHTMYIKPPKRQSPTMISETNDEGIHLMDGKDMVDILQLSFLDESGKILNTIPFEEKNGTKD